MTKKAKLAFLGISVAALYSAVMFSGSAFAQDNPQFLFMPSDGASFSAPSAFLAFCSREPEECKYDKSIPDELVRQEITRKLTEKLLMGAYSNNKLETSSLDIETSSIVKSDDEISHQGNSYKFLSIDASIAGIGNNNYFIPDYNKNNDPDIETASINDVDGNIYNSVQPLVYSAPSNSVQDIQTKSIPDEIITDKTLVCDASCLEQGGNVPQNFISTLAGQQLAQFAYQPVPQDSAFTNTDKETLRQDVIAPNSENVETTIPVDAQKVDQHSYVSVSWGIATDTNQPSDNLASKPYIEAALQPISEQIENQPPPPAQSDRLNIHYSFPEFAWNETIADSGVQSASNLNGIDNKDAVVENNANAQQLSDIPNVPQKDGVWYTVDQLKAIENKLPQQANLENSNNPLVNDDVAINMARPVIDGSKTDAVSDNNGQANLQPVIKGQLLIAWDAAVKNSLELINRQVNDEISSVSDMRQYGKSDYWVIPEVEKTRAGDCEDYVLQKRHTLMQMGYPAEAMNIAIVKTQRNEYHAVLVIRTVSGDFVLDNLSPEIKHWHDVPYKWVAKQSFSNPLDWINLASIN